jgi:chaperone required for assembly of F1-ATPase
MTWDATPEDSTSYDGPQRNTSIRVNGSELQLNPGADFVNTVKSVARDSQMGKFRLFLDGNEIKPSEAPSVVEEGMKLELRPYDVAG